MNIVARFANDESGANSMEAVSWRMVNKPQIRPFNDHNLARFPNSAGDIRKTVTSSATPCILSL